MVDTSLFREIGLINSNNTTIPLSSIVYFKSSQKIMFLVLLLSAEVGHIIHIIGATYLSSSCQRSTTMLYSYSLRDHILDEMWGSLL